VGLIARGLELSKIATSLTTWGFGFTHRLLPPRATYTHLARGATLGQPGDEAQQKRVLDATLALLSEDAPFAPVKLDERA
jgi:hypothetical protein